MKQKSSMWPNIPGCVEGESRCCFGIKWFDDEAKADAYAAEVRAEGRTYNGGWYHGLPCGRDKTWDRLVDGVQLYAVTD